MKKTRALALALACALSLSLLSACGGSGSGTGSDTSDGGETSQSGTAGSGLDQSGAGSSLPDRSLPDASGDGSGSNGGSASVSQEEPSQPVQPELRLNRTDFTLFSAGSAFQLKYVCQPDIDAIPEFSSSDEAVATVAQDGTVTAVAPGQATITLQYGDLTASCTVRCRWEESSADTGDSSTGGTGDSSQGGTETPSEPETPAAESVDLQAFFDTINTAYEMPFMMALDSTMLDNYYSGLSAISTQQMVIYQCGMNPSPAGDVALVQVTEGADVDAVKAIFQARVDYMVESGAWYPEPTAMWQNSSRIVSNGNYVMLVVNQNCDSIVSDFNALF